MNNTNKNQYNWWTFWTNTDTPLRWKFLSIFGFIWCILLVIEALIRLVYHTIVISALFLPSFKYKKFRKLVQMHVYLWNNYLDYLLGFALASVPIIGIPHFYFLVLYHGDERGEGAFFIAHLDDLSLIYAYIEPPRSRAWFFLLGFTQSFKHCYPDRSFNVLML